ncbi:TonB-dependent receptor-like protein [Maribacter vaceletii]|uniref:TonB-dependent receptor-like protein n=1 Tax=Maribacter vaceletii TaxID=1206816 RepID=A0A495ECW9_9FLAO|nr:TonB-dependent receptor plug domain-containing protein [Maribacter vaceletii]RKR14728.1 TonB-dependent receptor-like protein [Maribacter vaceletii]
MKRTSIYISSLVIIFLFSAFQKSSIENSAFEHIFSKLATYIFNGGPEKVYLQTDKDFYTNGETIWFKAYLLDGITHYKSSKSKVIYVELVDKKDSIITHKKIYVDDFAAGDIKINNKIKQGTYLLRSYTKYMLNKKEPVFFQKEIPIWTQNIFSNELSKNIPTQKENILIEQKTIEPNFQFFPEGGDLVYGIKSVIGIKVTDSIGSGIALQGKIVDQDNNMVVPFRSYSFGLGSTSFTPEATKKYYASTIVNNIEKRFPLPNPISKGYVLTIENKGDYINIQAKTNIPNGLNGTLLLGHLRGITFLKHIEKSNQKKSFSIKLMSKDIEDGVAQFTLFTSNGEPVCERLVFIDHPDNDTKLSINTTKKEYNTRDKVAIEMELTDAKGNFLDGDFSMSVVTSNNLKKESKTIKSWLLLNSDIGGTISNANYFFKDNTNATKYLLDALMLTHGWRRFVWKNLLNDSIIKKQPFIPEKGIMINGQTTAFKNRHQPKKTDVTISILEKGIYQEKKTTNLQGKFSFGPFIFQDSVKGVIQVSTLDKEKEKEISIYIKNNLPKITTNYPWKKPEQYPISYAQEYLKETYRKKVNDFKYDPQVTMLEEVTIEAKKKTKKEIINEKINSLTIYGSPDNRLFVDSIPGTESASIFDLLRRVSGVRILGSFPNQTIQIRGASSLSLTTDPLFLIDGNEVPGNAIQGMLANEVMFIDVLKGAATAMYGSRGSNGVIALYTSTNGALGFNTNVERYPGVTNFEIKGFSKIREFYVPNYNSPKPEHKKQDYRTTLHWEPNIKLKGKDNSVVNFYTGDNLGEYLIKVEGITTDGRVVNSTYNFNVINN